jgi:peptidoglycan/LPS O-acetylase OafA/YrhL
MIIMKNQLLNRKDKSTFGHIQTKSLDQYISELRHPLMGLSMLAIMLFHQWFLKSNPFPFNVFHNFGHWGVDIFLFLSGIGLTHSLQRYSISTFYKRRFFRIVPSCLIFGITKYIIFILLGASIIVRQALNIGVISIASMDLWFIDAIVILYIISPFLYKFLRETPILTGICILIVYLICSYWGPVETSDRITPLGIISLTIKRLPVFSIGMYLSTSKKWNRNFMYISTSFLLLAIIMTIVKKMDFEVPYHYFIHSLILAIGTPSMILISIQLIRSLPFGIIKFLSIIGNYSLELYLVHEFVFCVMNVEYSHFNHILLFFAAFFISCITAYTLRIVTKMITQMTYKS